MKLATMSFFKRIGAVLALLASCNALLGEAVSDQEFEELVEGFSVSGHPGTLFKIAASDHPKAVETLLLAKEASHPVELVDLLGLEAEPEISVFIFNQKQLELGLAIAGHRPSWDKLVARFYIPDPCEFDGYTDSRHYVLERLAKVPNDRVMRFLGSLLYFDDNRPKAYTPIGDCYATSIAAALKIKQILGEKHEPKRPSEASARALVSEVKQWWVENASSYGVEDPQAPFVLNLEQPPNESPTSSKAPDTDSVEEGAPKGAAKEEEASGSWLGENWLVIAVFLVAIAATAVAIRLKRS